METVISPINAFPIELFYPKDPVDLIVSLFLMADGKVIAQGVTVFGAVYNVNGTKALNGVSVMSSSGRGTTTDCNGNYVIVVHPEDSIWFSYLGRPTFQQYKKDLKD